MVFMGREYQLFILLILLISVLFNNKVKLKSSTSATTFYNRNDYNNNRTIIAIGSPSSNSSSDFIGHIAVSKRSIFYGHRIRHQKQRRSRSSQRQKPVPEGLVLESCESDGECTWKGKCIKNSLKDGEKFCVCYQNCPGIIPILCKKQSDCISGAHYVRCIEGFCMCGGMDKNRSCNADKMQIIDLSAEQPRDLLPTPENPNELEVQVGKNVTLKCCINTDPRDPGMKVAWSIPLTGNSGMLRGVPSTANPKASNHDQLNRAANRESLTEIYDRCWRYSISRVRPKDAGSYTCTAYSSAVPEARKRTIQLSVIGERIKFFFNRIQRNRRKKSIKPKIVITVQSSGPNAINITWETVPSDFAINITVESKNEEDFVFENKSDGIIIVSELKPATTYKVWAKGWYGDDEENKWKHEPEEIKAIPRMVTTLEDEPSGPQNLSMETREAISHKKCSIRFFPPEFPNGHITHYVIEVTGKLRNSMMATSNVISSKNRQISSSNCDLNRFVPAVVHQEEMHCTLDDLKPNRDYHVKVQAHNGAGHSNFTELNKVCATDYDAPDTVIKPSPAKAENNTIILKLQSPSQENGPIDCYYVAVVPLNKNMTVEDLPKNKEDISIESPEKVIAYNTKESRYKIPHMAYIAESFNANLPSEVVIGDEDWIKGAGKCKDRYLGRFEAKDVKLKTNGVRYTGFLIVKVHSDMSIFGKQSRKAAIVQHYQHQKRAAAFVEESELISLDVTEEDEDDELYGRDQPKYSFSDYFQSVLIGKRPIGDGSWIGLTVALSFILMLLLVITAALIYFMHNKGWLKHSWLCFDWESNEVPDRYTYSQELLSSKKEFPPIPVEQLKDEYLARHRDSDLLFAMEFEALAHHKLPSSASEAIENCKKNRYNDIKAYDATRVRLTPIYAVPGSDYINANFIQGYKNRQSFIAAQGPLTETVSDFWRMVWEQSVQIIIMVTNLQEKYRAQCTKYWPEDEQVGMYGNLEVRPTNAAYYADFTVRTFEMKKIGGERSTAGDASHIYDSVPPTTGSSTINRHSHASSFERTGSGRSQNPPTAAGAGAGGTFERTGSSRSARSRHSSMSTTSCNRIEQGSTSSSSLLNNHHAVQQEPPSRIVQQWHYTGWHDYRAPECTVGLLRFLMRLRALAPFSQSPVVVHCSAGVGRTGTFIGIDGILSQCEEEGVADVFGFISNLRKQRNFMVQSLEQYVFVYKALAEWLTFGDTDIETDQLKDLVPKLRKQYSMLSESLDGVQSKEFSRKPGNECKNRDAQIVPYDRNRVILQPVLGLIDASYINASAIRGYHSGYILSQDPMIHSKWDFWRMISEQKISNILMLTSEHQIPSEERYWPNDVGSCGLFGDANAISVTLIEQQTDDPVFKLRKFKYSNPKDGPGKEETVWQWSYNDWYTPNHVNSNHQNSNNGSSASSSTPAAAAAAASASSASTTVAATPASSSLPSSTASILHLIQSVFNHLSDIKKFDQINNGNGNKSSKISSSPILIHCRDGSTRSGLFCALILLLERLKAEGRVDIFQTVKSLRSQRPAIIQSFSQYQFLHTCLMDYLEMKDD